MKKFIKASSGAVESIELGFILFFSSKSVEVASVNSSALAFNSDNFSKSVSSKSCNSKLLISSSF